MLRSHFKSGTMCFYEQAVPTCALNQLDIYAQAYVEVMEPSQERHNLFPDKLLEIQTTTRHKPVNQSSPSRALK